MRIAVLGGDRRMDMLAQRLRARHNVYRDVEKGLLSGMDLVIAQRPDEADLMHMRPGAGLILLGGTAHGPEGVRCTDLMRNEEYVRRNAVLTAEGAVCAAMNATDGAVCGSHCLVAGYGRIARALAGMLKGLGAHVTVAARRAEARDAARAEGMGVVGMDRLAEAASQADYIFSTPPAMLFDEGVLAQVRPGVPVIDLASPPYGVDLLVARRLGVTAWRESGLPGRYCPEAAAALTETMVEAWIANQ